MDSGLPPSRFAGVPIASRIAPGRSAPMDSLSFGIARLFLGR